MERTLVIYNLKNKQLAVFVIILALDKKHLEAAHHMLCVSLQTPMSRSAPLPPLALLHRLSCIVKCSQSSENV